MEQKQLDEIEQSFTGEEFIEDDIIIEQVRPKAKVLAKPVSKPKKEVREAVKEVKELKENKKLPERKVAEAHKGVAFGAQEGQSPSAQKVRISLLAPKDQSPLSVKRVAEVKAAKAEKKMEKTVKEASKMESVTPAPKAEPKIEVWQQEPPAEESKGWFKEVSTWKTITGIVLILLLLSVFTQGFSFAKGSGITGAAISQGDAETQALAFVNDNLLQPPFTAQVTSTEEMGSLYKITFNIAGEEVDSYMTKDGALFFPQGFDPQKSLVEQLSKSDAQETVPSLPAAEAAPGEETIEEVIIDGTTGEVTTRQVPREEAETAPVEETTIISGQTEYVLKAKKWLFSPSKITVPVGSTITLRITPEDMESFTFLLQAFGVRQQVSGPTTVQFTADKKGSFPFLCGSCEERRGMSGTIVVE